MTGAVMTPLTPAAGARLDDYLAAVRAALAGAPDVNPDEVAADIREHVAAEFRDAARPVTAAELEAVLARLGPPAVWAPVAGGAPGGDPFDWAGFVAGLRRRALGVVATLWRGPDDWRLAYLTFGLTLLAVPTMGLALLVAYPLGRAAVELAAEKGTRLGARRWLVYPAVLAVSLPLFLAAMLWPVVAFPAAFERVASARTVVEMADRPAPRVLAPGVVERRPHPEVVAESRRLLAAIPGPRSHAATVAGWLAVVGAVALWWTVAGTVMWAFPRWPAAVFHPLLDGYDALHGLRLAACSLLGFVIWLGFATQFADKAGLG